MKRKLLLALLLLALSVPASAEDRLAWGVMGMMGTPATGCAAAYGPELNTTQTATSPTGVTEADATTGWAALTTPATFASSETAASLGTSHLDVVADSGDDGANYALTGLSLSASTVYKASFDVRHNGTGGNWLCGIGDGATGSYFYTWPLTSANTAYANKTVLFLYNTREDNLQCKEDSGTNNGGIYVDNFSIKAATLCYGSELHTTANAAALSGEADATTGWTAQNSLNSFDSVSTGTPQDGTYHLIADATTNPAANNGFSIDLGAAPFSLVDGTRYLLRFFVKHIGGGGDAWKCGNASAADGVAGTTIYQASVLNSTTTYTEYGWELTAAAAYRYFVCHEFGANNNGGVYLDGFSVKAITGE